MDNTNKREKSMQVFTKIIVALALMWAILPILVLGENYVYTIHDGLDSYAGFVQRLHDNHMYFRLSEKMPFMNDIEGKYAMFSYTLYDALNCLLGYRTGQILTRVIGVLLGFCSMRMLLHRIYSNRDTYQESMISLLSVAYAITPVAPIRMLGYASLPLVIYIYLFLRKEKSFSYVVFVAILLPLLSSFQAVYIFVLGFWFVFTVCNVLKNKKINCNLVTAFIGMCIVTILANLSIFKVIFTASETNRELYVDESRAFFDFSLFKTYLIEGHYHSTALQKQIILPFLLLGTLVVLVVYIRGVRSVQNKISMSVLGFGWGFWVLSAFIRTLQEGGFKTGILIIDGYQWGESIALMRIIWYLMFAAIVFSTISNYSWRLLLVVVVCLQLVNITTNPTKYNDTFYSISNVVKSIKGESSEITYKEFFSEELFERIKKDINYSSEKVVAYGFHPSVLMYNNFYTLDGYLTVHSMEWQLQFREIIAPALDVFDNYRSYYDEWGGRMYLFGELDFMPTKQKDVPETPLYIDTAALKKYGGEYVFSRAAISNAEDLGLAFVNDYNSEESLYHIYLYKVE